MPSRYPSGINGDLPDDDGHGDPKAWAAHVAQAIEHSPISPSAPCQNPECAGPVDYLGGGPAPLYCSHACRSRAANLRARALQQLDVLERLSAATKEKHGIPREDFAARTRMLRWWLVRLATHDERHG